ncbi:glycosyltransferase family 2 protein [Candidatus Pacearchaeota archaeon]|nr:glycosyltransferase family 2 protein [Candidatus Pacearchaeota archaeon]
MKRQPKISIIMPVYNSEKYLKKSIGSVLNQTLREIELICINDCSTDNSLKILMGFQKKDKRIKILSNKKNIGPGESRNIGINIAKGEYVCFLDSDDWLEKNACEILIKKAKSGGADIVYIRPKIVFSNRIILDKRLLTEKDASSIDKVFRKNLMRKVAWAPWSKMIKRDILLKNKIFFPKIHIAEDMDFSARVIYFSKKITFAEEYLYNYYVREGSLMSFSNSKRRIENYFESIKLLEDFLLSKDIFEKYHKEFVYFKLYNYLATYGVMYYSKEKIDKKFYKKQIKNDPDFRIFNIFSLGVFDSVIIGSVLIKLHLFNLVFKIREFFRVFLGFWGKRNH